MARILNGFTSAVCAVPNIRLVAAERHLDAAAGTAVLQRTGRPVRGYWTANLMNIGTRGGASVRYQTDPGEGHASTIGFPVGCTVRQVEDCFQQTIEEEP